MFFELFLTIVAIFFCLEALHNFKYGRITDGFYLLGAVVVIAFCLGVGAVLLVLFGILIGTMVFFAELY